ncbi:conserved hypothetical protein [Alphaproteobacteria bacterium]
MTRFNSVKEWFTEGYSEQKNFKFIGSDLDSFLDRNSDPLCFVKKGIKMLNELIELCEEEGILEKIMPSIVIPLKYVESTEITIFDPKTFILEDELDDVSPGDIYLTERDEVKCYVITEEYRRDIDIRWPVPLHRNCKIYYRCWRGEDELKHNWQEFYRCIYIKHYTDDLLKFCKN